ncbi:hypothetical protein LTR67_001930 [Exophiala xenobiotica]
MIWCIVPIVLKLLKVQGNVVAGTTVKTPFNRQSTAKKTSSPTSNSSTRPWWADPALALCIPPEDAPEFGFACRKFLDSTGLFELALAYPPPGLDDHVWLWFHEEELFVAPVKELED